MAFAIDDIHASVPLSNLSIAYQQNAPEFDAARLIPTVPVDNISNTYWIYERDAFMRWDGTERAPAAESVGTHLNVSTDTYRARVYAVHADIPDMLLANADMAFNLDQDHTNLVTRQLGINQMQLYVARMFGTGIWGTDLAGVPGSPSTGQFKQWDQAGATPIEDVAKQADAIGMATGYRPNKLLIGPDAARSLLNSAEIVGRVVYTSPGFLNTDILATAFGVDQVVVPRVIQNTAQEGATRVTSYLFGKSALLFYAPDTAGLRTVSAAMRFAWTGYLGGTSDTRIKRFRIEERALTRIEGEQAFDIKVTGPDLGVFFGSAVA